MIPFVLGFLLGGIVMTMACYLSHRRRLREMKNATWREGYQFGLRDGMRKLSPHEIWQAEMMRNVHRN